MSCQDREGYHSLGSVGSGGGILVALRHTVLMNCLAVGDMGSGSMAEAAILARNYLLLRVRLVRAHLRDRATLMHVALCDYTPPVLEYNEYKAASRTIAKCMDSFRFPGEYNQGASGAPLERETAV